MRYGGAILRWAFANLSGNMKNRAKPRLVGFLKQFFYSNLVSPRRLFQEKIELILATFQRAAILDLGCGYEAPLLTNLQCDSAIRVGLDIVPDLRPSAGTSVRFVRADSGRLPFNDRTFDLITSRSVLEHMEHPMEVFAEVHRVLRPGGHFVFLTPNRWDYVSLAATLIPNRFHARVVRSSTGRPEEDTFPTQYRANSVRCLRGLATRAGLSITELQRFRQHPHYLQFSSVTYALGLLYEQFIQRPIPSTRPWIMGVVTRPDPVGVPMGPRA